jgi:hypothetical protein
MIPILPCIEFSPLRTPDLDFNFSKTGPIYSASQGSRSHGFLQGTTGVPAVARQFHRVSRILTILATVFAAFSSQTIASWMSTLFVFHNEIAGSSRANLRILAG